MRVAVDAMGGDKAPDVNVEGAIVALAECPSDLEIVLVGDERVLEPLLVKYNAPSERLSIQHASQVIGMSEPPAQALRSKPDSSINVMYRLQKEQQVVAAVSAGSTGAMMAGGLMALRRLKGVKRPALAAFMPTERGVSIILDVGANVDCKPEYLVQFADMGDIYYKYMFKKEEPTVGLLNIGEESSKGNELAVETYKRLAGAPLNFVGNVEGRGIFKGAADVIVCDGFVGNVVLKFAEGVISFLKSGFKKGAEDSMMAKAGLLMLKSTLQKMAKSMDYDEYGGAPLLGINGVGIVCHGGSNKKAIKNAILVAKRYVDNHVNAHIREQLQLKHG